MSVPTQEAAERLRRWRLVLGGGEADGTGYTLSSGEASNDAGIDRALGSLYDAKRGSGLGASALSVPRWLGDIRTYFPTSVVQMLQKDALERLHLTQMLTEPELLTTMVADVALVATLLSLHSVLPAKVKETARFVVKQVVDDLMRRLETPMKQAVGGALSRASRTRRPRHAEIDWQRTIQANLRHWQADYGTIIPETRIGFGRRRSSLKDVILLIDQSGSMAESVVYSSIFGAVMASIRALRTRLIVFDTQVADLTDELADPVEVLFSVQLGGGTDINRAVAYATGRIGRPQDTIMVLISDLIEGGVRNDLMARAARLHASGVTLIVLLALSDSGTPAYDHEIAAHFAAMGIAVFACTPDLFPGMMAAAIRKDDLGAWASRAGIGKVA